MEGDGHDIAVRMAVRVRSTVCVGGALKSNISAPSVTPRKEYRGQRQHDRAAAPRGGGWQVAQLLAQKILVTLIHCRPSRLIFNATKKLPRGPPCSRLGAEDQNFVNPPGRGWP